MKKIIFTLSILVGSLFAFGQNLNPLDEKYQPPKNSIFSSNVNSNSSSNSNSPSNRKKNQVSFLFTDLSRSDLRFEYERQLNSSISATGGFGFSFGTDYIEKNANLYIMSDDVNNNRNYDIKGLGGLYSISNHDNGYSFSFGLKKYFNENDNNSNYMNFQWKLTNNKYSINTQELYSSSSSDFNPADLEYQVRLSYFSYMFGTSFRSSLGKTCLVNDFSIGFGLKLAYYDKFILEEKPLNLQTEYDNTWYTKKDERLNYKNPFILFRYQLGIAW